jgi:ribonuclease T2
MRKAIVTALSITGLLAASSAFADGEQAGDFDYYVLALSWSPTWCALEGDARGSEQCERDLGWVVHGLWPQNETGWPSYCNTPARDPSRSQTAEMADIMGTSGAAWYQWKKHGRCAGLEANAYFDTLREAYDTVERPAAFRSLEKDVLLPASVVEQAFLQSNPQLSKDQVTVTCRDNRIQEVRICLDKDLDPRQCGSDVIKDCTLDKARLDHID